MHFLAIVEHDGERFIGGRLHRFEKV